MNKLRSLELKIKNEERAIVKDEIKEYIVIKKTCPLLIKINIASICQSNIAVYIFEKTKLLFLMQIRSYNLTIFI